MKLQYSFFILQGEFLCACVTVNQANVLLVIIKVDDGFLDSLVSHSLPQWLLPWRSSTRAHRVPPQRASLTLCVKPSLFLGSEVSSYGTQNKMALFSFYSVRLIIYSCVNSRN